MLAWADVSFNIDGTARNSINFGVWAQTIWNDYSVNYSVEDSEGNWLADIQFYISSNYDGTFYVERFVTTADGVSGSSYERSPWWSNYYSDTEWASIDNLPTSSFYKVTVWSSFAYDSAVGGMYNGAPGWAWAEVTHKDGNYGAGRATSYVQ